MDYAITTFAPFVFTWRRTQEIFELLQMGYVFPALADAILLPDMFGYKYNDPEDGMSKMKDIIKVGVKKIFLGMNILLERML